jgi:transcriptional regulator with XRE-family HTH domain
MITGAQIRAARAALGWSAQILADRTGIGVRTIIRFEAVDDVPSSRSTTLRDVQTTLESAGIEFIGTPTDRPGIRLALPRQTPE